jgi:hypothetical protein
VAREMGAGRAEPGRSRRRARKRSPGSLQEGERGVRAAGSVPKMCCVDNLHCQSLQRTVHPGSRPLQQQLSLHNLCRKQAREVSKGVPVLAFFVYIYICTRDTNPTTLFSPCSLFTQKISACGRPARERRSKRGRGRGCAWDMKGQGTRAVGCGRVAGRESARTRQRARPRASERARGREGERARRREGELRQGGEG